MPESDRKQTGVSWNDVWNWCSDLEKSWHCYVEFKQWRVRKEGFYGRWDVRLTCSWLGVGGAVTRTESLSVCYPNNESKTLPGAQLRLLIDMDKKLSEMEHEKRSGAIQQTRFA